MEPFHITTTASMIIHDLPDGGECRTRKPALICACGDIQIRWLTAPASSIAYLYQRWWMEGLVYREGIA